MSKTFLSQAIQFCQTVLFQTIQFSLSTQFSWIWPIDGTLSGATTPVQSGSGRDDNEGVIRIPQSSCITGTSSSYCLVSYPGHSVGWVLPLYRGAVGVFYSPSRLDNIFILLSAGAAKSTRWHFFVITRFGFLTGIEWFLCTSSLREFCVSFSQTDSCLYKNHFEVWLNFKLLHHSKWITFHLA